MQCLAWDSILSILEEKRMLQAILLYKLTEMNSDNGLDIWIISVLVVVGWRAGSEYLLRFQRTQV